MVVAIGPTLFEVTHSSGGLIMGTFGSVCVAVWKTKPTHRLFDIQRDQLAKVVREQPGSAVFICVVQPSADPPDQELRYASTEMIVSHGKNLAAVAGVIEGSGFRAAITRTVLTGILFVIRNPSPFRFFESVESSVSWLGERVGKAKVLGLPEHLARTRLELSEAGPRGTMTA
jgi:hypothetical protein